MLTLKFGTYSHLLGEVDLKINRVTQFSEANKPVRETVTWDIGGRAEGTDLPSLLTALATLNRAYQQQNQYPIVTLGDSSGNICHTLNGPKSIGGIRIEQPPSFMRSEGAELTTYRNYQIRLAADFYIGNPAMVVMQFNETVSFSGGGPDRGMIELSSGLPVEYISRTNTAYRCTQSGHAIGFAQYPVWLAQPLFPPALFEGPQQPITFASPRAEGFNDTNWGISWEYRFVSAVPLVATPRRFPR